MDIIYQHNGLLVPLVHLLHHNVLLLLHIKHVLMVIIQLLLEDKMLVVNNVKLLVTL